MKTSIPSLGRKPWNRSVVLAAILVTISLVLILHHINGIQYDIPQLLYPARLRASGKQSTSDGHAPRNITKAIITSVQRKDERTADWIPELLPDWQPYIYATDRTSDELPEANVSTSRVSPASLPVNRGREASVYLTYIIQHYYDLPDFMVFIHGKRYQIHNDDPMLDTLPTIARLNVDYVKKEGYTSLRCNWMHCPGPQVEPLLGHEDDIFQIRGLYASAWAEFFPNEPIPVAVSGPCCAQFAVTREVVQRWPLDKYEQIRQWMWRQEGDQASMDTGLVLEYLWHILFGKPAIFCPEARECYRKNWGLCELECEREGWCLGRVWLNPEKSPPLGLPRQIPVGWPEEGQTERGYWPFQGWWNDPEIVKEH